MTKMVHNGAAVSSGGSLFESALQMRERVVRRALVIIAILSIPSALVSTSRLFVIGWRPVLLLYPLAVVGFWTIVLLRRKLGTGTQVIAFFVILFIVAVGGLAQLGQISIGEFLLGLACMLVASTFGLRSGMLAIGVCSAANLAIFAAFRYGLLVLDFDVARYAQSPHAWLIGLVGFIFVGGVAVALAGAMQDALGRLIEKLQDRTTELECAVGALNHEVEDRRRIEENLRASEARFESVFSQAAVGIGIQSREGTWLQANERACAIFGYTAEEMVDLSFLDLTHPDDRVRSRAAVASMAAGDADSVRLEKRYIHRDGSTIWANSYDSVVRDEKGDPLFHVVVIEDVTERKRVEEEKRQFYREAISSVTDGKLQVVGGSESEAYWKNASIHMTVESPEHTVGARRRIRDYCELRGLSGDALELYVVGLGEAMSNAIKHAGSGEVFAGSDGDLVWVGVVDDGPGIATLALPSATLRRGYSTKLSMGFGYAIMLNVADRIVLSTGPTGSRVVLIKHVGKGEPEPILEDFRDTWDTM